MKIVSQVLSAVPEATNKKASVDASTGNFQSAFASASAAARSTASAEGAKLAQGQDGITKKAASPDEKKKSSAPGLGVQTTSSPVSGDSLQVTPVPNVPSSRDLEDVGSEAAAPALQMGVVSASSGNSNAAELGDLPGKSVPLAAGGATAPDNSLTGNVSAQKPGTGAKPANVFPVTAAVPMPSAALSNKIPDVIASKALDSVGDVVRPSAASAAEPSSQTDTTNNVAAPSMLPVAVPPTGLQQGIAQDPNISTVPSSLESKVSAAKAAGLAVGGMSTGAVSGKGKAAPSRTSGAVEEKQATTGTESDVSKARVEASTVVDKDVSGATKDLGQPPVLTQTAIAAQMAGAPANASASQAATPSTNGTAGPAMPASAASAGNVQAAHAMSGAQLIQTAHGSEMRLGMQSAEFGNISINTSLSRQTLSAQISIDHSALGHALAAHLPAIQEKLGGAYGVQAKVELRETATNSSLNDSGRESKGRPQTQSGANGASTAASQGSPNVLTTLTYTSPVASASRLDIRV